MILKVTSYEATLLNLQKFFAVVLVFFSICVAKYLFNFEMHLKCLRDEMIFCHCLDIILVVFTALVK